MLTFIIGLLILNLGGFIYGHYLESVFKPDDRETPATASYDGLDFVGQAKWKNILSQLLNSSGTAPILGAVQGMLFGPLAFLAIPLGSVLFGAMHDYFSGMIALRNNGEQMPRMIKKYLGKNLHAAYSLFMMVLMLLLAAVFIYTPAEIILGDILKQTTHSSNPTMWVIYGLIFLYYLIATFFPIRDITARVHPIFSALLGLAAIGVFIGLVFNWNLVPNVDWQNLSQQNQAGVPWFPIFFVTLSSGILSSFHATQASLVARSITYEKEGKQTFFNTMLMEGFIAMAWAAGAMIVVNATPSLAAESNGAIARIQMVAQYFLGNFGALLVLISAIVLSIASAETALTSLRMILSERFNIDQVPKIKRALLSILLFLPTGLLLYFAKIWPNGFQILWQYFNFANLLVATFALTMISTYLLIHKKNAWIALLPAMFYVFILASFILHAPLGFNLLRLEKTSYCYSYFIAGLLSIIFAFLTVRYAKKSGLTHEENQTL